MLGCQKRSLRSIENVPLKVRMNLLQTTALPNGSSFRLATGVAVGAHCIPVIRHLQYKYLLEEITVNSIIKLGFVRIRIPIENGSSITLFNKKKALTLASASISSYINF
jgi:hypothetical protein